MKEELTSSRSAQLLVLLASFGAIGCGSSDKPTGTSTQGFIGLPNAGIAGESGGIGGQNGGVGGQTEGVAGSGVSIGPMPGLGTMMMTPPSGSAGGPPLGAAGASGSLATSSSAGHAGIGASGMGGGGQAGAAGAAGGGTAGSAGAAGGGAAAGDMDPTTVCMGGKPGKDSDQVTTVGQTSSRNFAIIQYLLPAPNKIARFQTILTAPKIPAQPSTLFIWPGLQHNGGSDPAFIGNGVLQPVLTWGPSCNPMAPAKGNDYMGWWISAMYVNISTAAAGPGGCAGGNAMDVAVADRLYIDFAVKGTSWTQTILNLTNMKKVDFTTDLKGQDQNWAIWDIETPGYSVPAADTYFDKSVLTFTSPVTSCQPTSASEIDYFSAPVLSADGLNCCFDQIILKANRT